MLCTMKKTPSRMAEMLSAPGWTYWTESRSSDYKPERRPVLPCEGQHYGLSVL